MTAQEISHQNRNATTKVFPTTPFENPVPLNQGFARHQRAKIDGNQLELLKFG
jgi:hypothetical protein